MSRGAISALGAFEQAARGERSPEVRPLIADSNSPVQQISKVFRFQSYFDSTLLERAILAQKRNEPIVQSTFEEVQIPGYAIGLAPWSQTVVAMQFKVGGQATSSQPVILKPGQVVRPHGLPRGMTSGSFSGFAWGIPFGWLGGGLATIFVFQTPDADVNWPGDSEVIFHRTRMIVKAPASAPTNAPKNWPLRFPWTQASQGTNSVPQQGQPAAAIAQPTQVLMRLRLTTLAAPATMRIIVHESNDFDLDSAGAVIATPSGFIDFTWPSFAAAGIGAGNLITHYPMFELPTPLARLAADDGGLALVDLSGGSLADAYVDFVRYGRL